jgi:hypothetical protein
MNLNELRSGLEPCPYSGALVVLCVVGDEMDLPTFVVPDQLVQQQEKGFGIKLLGEAEVPFGALVNADGPQGLYALSGRETLDLTAYSFSGPRTVDRPGLLKAHFVLVEQYASILLDFFFTSPNSCSIQQRCCSGSAFDRRRVGYCTENPRL